MQLLLLGLLLVTGIVTASPHRRRDVLLGWGVLVVAFVSPLCALTASLFSARVVHHLLLVAAAAPLLARAWPMRRRGSTAVAGALFVAAMGAWHWPPAYLAAYDSVPIYWAMQSSLLVFSIMLWRSVAAPGTAIVPALATLTAISGAMSLLGGLLTFAPLPLYAPHLATTESFGLTALHDQQLGGLLLWVPGMLPFVLAGILLAGSRFRTLARRGMA